MVKSETRVLVSHPPLPKPPPSGPTTSPPKMLVSRRMKVDFPQPESAATPMTTGTCPFSSAMLRAEEEEGAPRRLAGRKAEEVEKAEAVAASKTVLIRNFMLDTIYTI